MAFELADVVPNRRFSTRTRMPLTDVVFEHEYLVEEASGPARIRHSVIMAGLLAPLFGQVDGPPDQGASQGDDAEIVRPRAVRRRFLIRITGTAEVSVPGAARAWGWLQRHTTISLSTDS